MEHHPLRRCMSDLTHGRILIDLIHSILPSSFLTALSAEYTLLGCSRTHDT